MAEIGQNILNSKIRRTLPAIGRVGYVGSEGMLGKRVGWDRGTERETLRT